LWLGLEREREIDWLSVCALKRWWKPVRFVCFLVSPGKRSKLHCCVVFCIAVFQWNGALWSWLSLLAFAALSVYGFFFLIQVFSTIMFPPASEKLLIGSCRPTDSVTLEAF
jgi:hypothetical protein